MTVTRDNAAFAPVPAGLAHGLPGRIWETLRLWRRRSKERGELLDLEDRVLKDIGLSRYEASREAAKPFWRP